MKTLKRYCSRILSLLASQDFKPGFIAITRMRCKQWDCEFCSIKNGDMWRAHLLDTFLRRMLEKHWVFVTLTAPSWSHHNPMKSLTKLKRAWGKMYDKLRYKNKGRLSYVMVYETHESGAFHCHALVDMGVIYDAFNAPIDATLQGEERVDAEKAHPFGKWLKNAAVDAKAGWVCHATRIQEGDTSQDNCRLAVGYVTKYFTKGAAEMKMPPRWRRIGTSRDIGSPKTKAKKEFSWQVRQFITPKDAQQIPHYLLGEEREIDASDFGDEGIYPASE